MRLSVGAVGEEKREEGMHAPGAEEEVLRPAGKSFNLDKALRHSIFFKVLGLQTCLFLQKVSEKVKFESDYSVLMLHTRF